MTSFEAANTVFFNVMKEMKENGEFEQLKDDVMKFEKGGIIPEWNIDEDVESTVDIVNGYFYDHFVDKMNAMVIIFVNEELTELLKSKTGDKKSDEYKDFTADFLMNKFIDDSIDYYFELAKLYAEDLKKNC